MMDYYFLIKIFYAFLTFIGSVLIIPEIIKYLKLFGDPPSELIGILIFFFLILCFLLVTAKVFTYELIYTIRKAKSDAEQDKS